MKNRSWCVLTLALLLETTADAQADLRDVTQPGDPLVPTSYNSPQSEPVANAIDDRPTKYMNFDKLNTGFTVSPRGSTIISALSLTSANDHAERDPASYVLSGSLDNTNFTEISSGPVAPFTNRFEKQIILFNNETAYLHYRLIFPTVRDPILANSMHISEVELLTALDPPPLTHCPPEIVLIEKQPMDTPVLLGARATFRVGMNGPWRLQWYRNGVEIPGATTFTYVTPPATAADDGARYRVRVTGRDCWQDSDEVVLSIFTPSSTESIGLNWIGEGGASAPFPMWPEDITGLFPQAYWNNLKGSTGSLAGPTNNNNQPHPTITVQWATSGEWNSGAGDDYPAQRMFSGLCTSYGTNPATAQTVTFSGVPPGYHSLLLYTVQIPLEFFNMDFQVLTFQSDGTSKPTIERFIRPQNGDEYYARPGFVLINSQTRATRAVGNSIWINNLQPEDGRIQIRFFAPGRRERPPPADPVRGPGLNGLQLLLNPIVLNITITPANELLLSWPTAGTDFNLEATEQLHPPDWRLVGSPPMLRDEKFEVRLPINKSQEHFRLRR